MQKGNLVVGTLLGLVAGILIGGFTTSYFLSKFFIDASYISEVADSTINLEALSQIHSREIDSAVKTLETGLDGSAIYFENVASEISEITQSKVKRSLSEIREYNLKYRPGVYSPASNKLLQPTANASAE